MVDNVGYSLNDSALVFCTKTLYIVWDYFFHGGIVTSENRYMFQLQVQYSAKWEKQTYQKILKNKIP